MVTDTTETKILGVAISRWPVDELLYLPWHAVAHLTDDEKRGILARAKREGVERPNQWGPR
jgi:hypothetical protein